MKHILMLFVFLIAVSALAQPPDTLWTRTYGGEGNEIGWSIHPTSDGGYIIGCQIDGLPALWKLNALFETTWTHIYSDVSSGPVSVLEMPDHGYWVTSNYAMFRTDSLGDTLWVERTYRWHQWKTQHAIRPTSDGGFILCGELRTWIANPPTEGQNSYFEKRTSSGEYLWARESYCNYALSGVQLGTQNRYVVAGISYGSHTMCIDTCNSLACGNLISHFESVINGGDIVVTTDNGYAAIFGESPAQGLPYLHLIRGYSDGSIIWTLPLNLDFAATAPILVQTNDLGYLICCNASDDICLFKTNPQGFLQWTRFYGGQYQETVSDILALPDGGFLLLGTTNSFSIGGNDIYLIRTETVTGISNEQSLLIANNASLTVMPNPFNPSTTLEFSLSRREEVEIIAFDVQGRRVKEIVNQVYQPGTYQVPFDGSDLPTGLYFARLTTPGFTQTQKLLLLR